MTTSISLDDVLAPNRRQAVTWNYINRIHWRIYGALGEYDLDESSAVKQWLAFLLTRGINRHIRVLIALPINSRGSHCYHGSVPQYASCIDYLRHNTNISIYLYKLLCVIIYCRTIILLFSDHLHGIEIYMTTNPVRAMLPAKIYVSRSNTR